MSEEKRVFHLVHREARQRALACINDAPDGYKVTVEPPKRTEPQSERFHAMRDDIARQLLWGGKKRTRAQWKVLLISAHAHATDEGMEVVPGLEGEFVNLRESMATMGKRRTASLIEYVRAWGDTNGVRWSKEGVDDAAA